MTLPSFPFSLPSLFLMTLRAGAEISSCVYKFDYCNDSQEFYSRVKKQKRLSTHWASEYSFIPPRLLSITWIEEKRNTGTLRKVSCSQVNLLNLCWYKIQMREGILKQIWVVKNISLSRVWDEKPQMERKYLQTSSLIKKITYLKCTKSS